MPLAARYIFRFKEPENPVLGVLDLAPGSWFNCDWESRPVRLDVVASIQVYPGCRFAAACSTFAVHIFPSQRFNKMSGLDLGDC